MATIVVFHAHPDDEAIATGGTMAKYAAAGHRVVLVTATKGEHGEVAEGFLAPGEELWERRVQELHAAAAVLGVSRVEFLGYVDSGMMGTPENDARGSFWRADTEDAAMRLARILDEEHAEVLTIYDDHGNYGHPDHIKVHRVGARAAELVGTPRVFEATMNRDLVKRLMSEFPMPDADLSGSDVPDADFVETLGMPEDALTTAIDVRDQLAVKRAAMAAHASQIHDTSFFLQMPDEVFARMFGVEWYIHRGVAPGIREDGLLEGFV